MHCVFNGTHLLCNPVDQEGVHKASQFLKVSDDNLVVLGKFGFQLVPAVAKHCELLDSYPRLMPCYWKQYKLC